MKQERYMYCNLTMVNTHKQRTDNFAFFDVANEFVGCI